MRGPINFSGSAQGDKAEEEEEENATAGGGRRVIVGNGYDFIRTRSPGRLGSAVMRGVAETRGGTSEGLIGRQRHYYWA